MLLLDWFGAVPASDSYDGNGQKPVFPVQIQRPRFDTPPSRSV